jgi:hypothetical protein
MFAALDMAQLLARCCRASSVPLYDYYDTTPYHPATLTHYPPLLPCPQAMERACFTGTGANGADLVNLQCRKIYYDTARDVLGLFRAIAPLVKAQDIKQVRGSVSLLPLQWGKRGTLSTRERAATLLLPWQCFASL